MADIDESALRAALARVQQRLADERDALRTQLAAAEARVAEMEASITPPIHDENCMRGATAATCEGCHPEALVQWVRERLVNCMRIAATKVGDDRALWLDDARYFAAILQALAPPPPSEGATLLRADDAGGTDAGRR